MKDPADKKSKGRRSSFDADLDAMLDEAELSLTPMKELLDEDAIDRLLVDDGFDADDDALQNEQMEPDNLDWMTDQAIAEQQSSVSTPDDLLDEEAISEITQDEEFELAQPDDVDIEDLQTSSSLIDTPVFDEFGDDFDTTERTQDDNIELTAEINANIPDDSLAAEAVIGGSLNQQGNDFTDLEVIDEDLVDITPPPSEPADEFGDESATPTLPTISFDEQDEFPDFPPDLSITDLPSDEDFLLADFDISPDPEPIEQVSAAVEDEVNTQLDDDESSLLQASSLPEVDQEQSTKTLTEEPAWLGELAFAQFKSEQDRLSKQQNKLLEDIESKAKKFALLNYAALGFGVLSLLLATYFGVVAYGAKNEVANLNELIGGLEKKLVSMPVKPEQPVSQLEHETAETSAKQATEGVEPAEHVNEDSEHKTETKEQDTKEALSKRHETNSSQHEQTVSSSVTHTDTKHEVTHDSAKEHETHKLESTDKVKVPETGKSASTTKEKDTTVAAEATKETTKQKSAEPDEPKAKSTTDKTALANQTTKVSTKKKSTNIPKKEKSVSKVANSGRGWSVNLVASKQDWYAKAKATEFRQKGIPVEIAKVNIDNVTWYRLRVGGFDSQAEASAYVGRVKKALNLSSAWVSK